MPGRLSGKVCVVTGTGGSMGRATALTFAREGGRLVGCDVAVESAEETLETVRRPAADGLAPALPSSAIRPTARGSSSFAVRAFGRIDVLFNLAAQVALQPTRGLSPTRSGMPHAETRSTWSSTSPARRGLI